MAIPIISLRTCVVRLHTIAFKAQLAGTLARTQSLSMGVGSDPASRAQSVQQMPSSRCFTSFTSTSALHDAERQSVHWCLNVPASLQLKVKICKRRPPLLTCCSEGRQISLITATSITAKFTDQLRQAALLTMDCSFVWRVRADWSPVVFQGHEL